MDNNIKVERNSDGSFTLRGLKFGESNTPQTNPVNINPNDISSLTRHTSREYYGDYKSSLRTGSNSRYNDDLVGLNRLDDDYTIDELRGEAQPWYDQLVAGVAKGTVLAGTTFLNGTAGLIYGTAFALANIGNENESGIKTFSRLWDNEISNGLQAINELSEKYIPNYKSKEENEASVLEKMGTMNFWADGILKNMGFMVGSMYSGSAWTQGLNAISKAVKLGQLSTMGARMTGTLLSATNEARIEANDVTNRLKETEYQKLFDAYQKEYDNIINSNLSINTTIEGGKSEKAEALDNLKAKYDYLKRQIDDNAAKAGAIDFALQLPLLAMDDFLLYGKIYSKGFSNARDVAANITKNSKKGILGRIKEAGERGFAAEESARIIKEGGKYVAKKLTNKEVWGGVIKTGAREGNEEMSQQLFSNFGTNLYTPDSPDAYYKALTNPDNQLAANDIIQTAVKSFMESYGTGSQWEQFAVGAISSMIGMPTFGKVNNSDANTWLGKGKSVGLSGGIFGEMTSAKVANQEAQRNVEIMNKAIDNLNNHKNYYAQSKSYTDAMDGFSEQQDKFEYKNAENNLDFATIQAYSNAGRLDDLKELVNQDFVNISEEELAKIAVFNTSLDRFGSPIGGWQTKDGKPLATFNSEDNSYRMSEENQQLMREKLEKKKNTILEQIDAYSEAIQTVRATGNNSLTDEQNQELAWLLWKSKQFSERFNGIKQENKSLFTNLINSLDEWERVLLEEKTNLIQDTKKITLINGEEDIVVDEEGANTKIYKENENVLSNIRAFKGFITKVQSTQSPLLLASFLKNNPDFDKLIRSKEFFDFVDLASYHTGLDFSKYSQTIQDLVDTERLARASETFNERYKEFVSDPISIITNRQKEEAKNQEKERIIQNTERKETINNKSVSELVQAAKAGENLDEYEDLFDTDLPSNEEFEATLQAQSQQTQPQQPQSAKEKIQEAKNIVSTSKKVQDKLTQLAEEGKITQEQLEDAKTLMTNSEEVSESQEELLDLESLAFNNPQALQGEIGNNSEEEYLQQLADRTEKAKEAIQITKQLIQDQEKEVQNIPDAAPTQEELDEASEKVDIVNNETNKAGLKEVIEKGRVRKRGRKKIKKTTKKKEIEETTGHDATVTIPTENEIQEKKDRTKEILEDVYSVKSMVKAIEDLIAEKDPRGLEFAKLLHNDIHIIVDSLSSFKLIEMPFTEAIATTKKFQSYSNVFSTLGQLEPIIINKLENWYNRLERKSKEEVKVESEETIMTTEETQDTTTEILNTEKLTKAVNEAEDVYQFWKPTTSEVTRGWLKGEQIPFYKIAEKTKNADGSPKFTQEQIKVWKALYEYAKEHNMWNNAFSIKEKDTINFIIAPEFNKKASGNVVIWMQVNGKIVGDLPLPQDATFTKQTGLKEFVNKINQEYKDWVDKGNTGIFMSKETSTVSKKMVGKVPYTDDVHFSLNEVFEYDSTENKTKIPFKLGLQIGSENSRVIMTPGRTRKQGPSEEEGTIIQPLKVKAGTPYLLLPTGSSKRAYMPVPIKMPRYSNETAKSKLGQEVDKVLQKLTTLKQGQEVGFIRELQELLSIPEIHLNFDDNGHLIFTIKTVDDTKQTTIYKGTQDNKNMVELIKKALYNSPFQISRKYINTTYRDGTDYNSMIGELATCNIDNTHLIDSWFTINPIIQNTQTKAKNIKSIKYNPHSKDAAFTYYTYSNSSGVQSVAINNVDYTLYKYNKNSKKWIPYDNDKDPLLAAFKAQTFINNVNKFPDKDGYYQTKWGLYDANKGIFVTPKEESSLPQDNEDNFIPSEDLSSLAQDEDTVTDTSIPNEQDLAGGTVLKTLGGETTDSTNVEKKESPIVTKVINTLSPFFEGGGALVEDYYPFLSKEYITKVEDVVWGTEELTEEEAKVILQQMEQTAPKEETPTQPTKSEAEIEAEVKKKGLLVTDITKRLWKELSLEQKENILSLPKMKAKNVVKLLGLNFSTKDYKFTKNPDEIISGAKHREVTQEHSKPINMKKEIAWLNKVLPQLSTKERTRIVEGFIKISNSENSGLAWGAFKDGVMFISNKAARGTVYHEVFHAVVNTLLTDSEIETLFKEAVNKYGNKYTIALEEQLAEDFRKYVQFEEIPIIGKVIHLFRTLKHIINNLKGKEPFIDNLFYRIQRGQFKDKQPNNIINPNYKAEFDEYYREKYMYGNLSQEDIQYLNERNISISDYVQMSPKEQEVLMHCKS